MISQEKQSNAYANWCIRWRCLLNALEQVIKRLDGIYLAEWARPEPSCVAEPHMANAIVDVTLQTRPHILGATGPVHATQV